MWEHLPEQEQQGLLQQERELQELQVQPELQEQEPQELQEQQGLLQQELQGR